MVRTALHIPKIVEKKRKKRRRVKEVVSDLLLTPSLCASIYLSLIYHIPINPIYVTDKSRGESLILDRDLDMLKNVILKKYQNSVGRGLICRKKR